MIKRVFVFALLVIFFLEVASANFSIGNSSRMEKDYYGNEVLRGKINISFENENSKSAFTSNFGGRITLAEVLNASGNQGNFKYSCSPSSCTEGYGSGIAPPSSNSEFNLGTQKTLIGFKLTGNISGVNQFNMEISSNINPSCKNQIGIDLFDSGEIEIYNNKFVDSPCGEKNYGCFNANTPSSQFAVVNPDSGLVYCQRMNVSAAPAYRIGAKVRKVSGNGEEEIGVGLFNKNGSVACVGGNHGGATTPNSNGEISVIARCSFNEPREVMVCISKQEGNVQYEVRYEQDANTCGATITNRAILSEVSADYEIYAQPLSYASIGTIDLASVYWNVTGKYLHDEVNKYIQQNYRGNCENGCFVPISLMATDVSDLGNLPLINARTTGNKFLQYTSSVGVINEPNFYRLVRENYTISSNYTQINIETLGFPVPTSAGEKEAIIYLDGREILKENISVEIGFDYGITPRIAIIGRPTSFSLTGGNNITSARWNYGDGSQTAFLNGRDSLHTFSSEGEYDVQIEATDAGGNKSVKRFKIYVANPRVSANVLINDYQRRMDDLNDKLNSFSEWTRGNMKTGLEFDSMSSGFTSLKNRHALFSNVTSDEEYMKLIDDLIKLNIPDSVFVSGTASFVGESGFSGINPAHLAKISNYEISDASVIRNGIIAWMNRYYGLDVEIKTYSSQSDSGREVVLREYKVIATKEQSVSNYPYLVIGQDFQKVRFKVNNDARGLDGGGTYISMGTTNTFVTEFAILGKSSPADVAQLGVYISPAIEELEISDKPYGGIGRTRTEFRWTFFVIALSVLLVVFFTCYLILQSWYRNNYERRLFKSPDDLYNLINFIYNSRKERKSDGEIRASLKSKDWKGEQIKYAFNKIDGKRTGMWEIPVFKFVENKKMEREIMRRQGGAPVDARFIKKRDVY